MYLKTLCLSLMSALASCVSLAEERKQSRDRMVNDSVEIIHTPIKPAHVDGLSQIQNAVEKGNNNLKKKNLTCQIHRLLQ
tara:strand:- start:2069 stop:2308 length:240 start_codon:yes stop_codon:yes gene_type:complete